MTLEQNLEQAHEAMKSAARNAAHAERAFSDMEQNLTGEGRARVRERYRLAIARLDDASIRYSAALMAAERDQ